MELFTLIKEVLRYLKSKWYLILATALIVGLAGPAVRIWLNRFETPEMAAAYQDLSHRYSQEAGNFQFIIQNEDGTMFTNAALIDEYLSQKAVVDQVEEATGLNYEALLENEQLLELNKTSQFRGGIAAIRNPSSEIMTLRILAGNNEEENLKITQAYADLLMNNQIPFLSGKSIELIHPVTNQALLSERLFPNLTSGASLQVVNPLNKKSLVILFVGAMLAGGLIGVFILFMLRFKDEKIGYAFDYAWGLDDLHYLYDAKKTQTPLKDLIEVPQGLERLVLSQEALEGVESHASFSQTDTDVEEIVILIQAGHTSKGWYRDIYKLAKLYQLPVKIIQINEEAKG